MFSQMEVVTAHGDHGSKDASSECDEFCALRDIVKEQAQFDEVVPACGTKESEIKSKMEDASMEEGRSLKESTSGMSILISSVSRARTTCDCIG